MKIILLKDVAKLGRRHEVKEVADGYGRNFIIARGLGMIADSHNLAKLKEWQARGAVGKDIQHELLRKALETVNERPVMIAAKANEQGHLFASIHAADISEALGKQFRLEIPSEMIALEEPIKSVGDTPVELKAAGEAGRLIVRVEALK